MILFSNGCSFLTSRPKDGVDTFTSKIIAEKYGMDLTNLAKNINSLKYFLDRWETVLPTLR